jgi:hypothetical protein
MARRAAMMERLERNKPSAIGFYDLMFSQSQPREAVAEYGRQAQSY